MCDHTEAIKPIDSTGGTGETNGIHSDKIGVRQASTAHVTYQVALIYLMSAGPCIAREHCSSGYSHVYGIRYLVNSPLLIAHS